MCFLKSSNASSSAAEAEEESVVRHEADASVTKNSNQNSTSGYEENLKTSAVGLTDEANVKKKTLLGE